METQNKFLQTFQPSLIARSKRITKLSPKASPNTHVSPLSGTSPLTPVPHLKPHIALVESGDLNAFKFGTVAFQNSVWRQDTKGNVGPRINHDVLQQELRKMIEERINNLKNKRPEGDMSVNGVAGVGTAKEESGGEAKPASERVNPEPKITNIIIRKPADHEHQFTGHRPASNGATFISPLNKSNVHINGGINFANLKEFLLLFFTHKLDGSHNCVLSTDEKSIFQAVLERKQHISQRGVINTSYRLCKNSRSTPRRSEEKFKFIIKRIIKHLKKRDGIKSDQEFYDIYFSDVSERLAIPLDRFYDPHNKILKNSSFKSLSTDYVMVLLKSDVFLVELLHYLETQLLTQHVRSLNNKVINLCKKWENFYNSLDCSKRSVQNIIRLILNTEKGSKLPWSIDEVKESMELMRNVIYSRNTQRFLR